MKIPKGFSLPLIDLTEETHRQVIVDRIPDLYLGQPDTILLEDNQTILVAYPNGHGGPDTVLKRSADGGLTWSDRLPVPESFKGKHNAPSISRLVGPDGKKRLLINTSAPFMQYAISEDDGNTWTDLDRMWRGFFGRGFKGHAPMKSVIPVSGGRYLGMYHDHYENDAGEMVVEPFTTTSEDGGLTWKRPVRAGSHRQFPGARACEPCMLRSPDGKQIMALLRENSRTYNSLMMVSDDEGATWSDMVELPGALTGDRHIARYAPDGRIVVTIRDMAHETPTRGDFVGWVGTYDDLLNQRQGQYRLRLLKNWGRPGDTGYSGLELLPDGAFVSTTYCVLNEGEQPLVVSVRFTLDELDAKYSNL